MVALGPGIHTHTHTHLWTKFKKTGIHLQRVGLTKDSSCAYGTDDTQGYTPEAFTLEYYALEL